MINQSAFIDCTNIKFRAHTKHFSVSKAYNSVVSFVQDIPSIQEGTFCKIIDEVKKYPSINISNFFLGECIVYDNSQFCMTVVKKTGREVDLKLISDREPEKLTGIALTLICTSNEPYITFLKRAINFYRINLSEFNYEINIAFFSNTDVPDFLKADDIRISKFPFEHFEMPFARNKSIAMSQKSHMLAMDLDCWINKKSLNELISLCYTSNYFGIANIKLPRESYPGNGLYFGETKQIQKNSYNQKFQKFWFEDTEYLMNFSRIGLVPYTFFTEFTYMSHGRSHTLKDGSWPINKKLFERILTTGGR